MFDKPYSVCLLVDNFQRSLDFYTNIFGLKTSYEDQKGKFASFKFGDASLGIFQKKEATGMFPKKYMKPSGGFLMGDRVNNLVKACKKLKEKGIKIFEGPKETTWGQKVAYFHDPDKNIWEVSEPFED